MSTIMTPLIATITITVITTIMKNHKTVKKIGFTKGSKIGAVRLASPEHGVASVLLLSLILLLGTPE